MAFVPDSAQYIWLGRITFLYRIGIDNQTGAFNELFEYTKFPLRLSNTDSH